LEVPHELSFLKYLDNFPPSALFRGMESSRIFIKGLPPAISEADFKKHFSARSAITDAKLIPHRRIGYIGYKSPEDAAKAVKYFNKSFIRMSKIGVEIARPVGKFAQRLCTR
jgi:RNA recognition motif-containing protein